MEVIFVLWYRQIRRYLRSGSRMIGTIGQPLLLMLALGYGIGAIYSRAGEGNYLEFLVPGIITQTVLLTGIFWGINILQEKRFGFLAELLVAPVSRLRILIGSTTGGATISVLQGIAVFLIALLLGFKPYDWALVIPALIILALMCIALASFGAGIASMVDDFQGFQSISNLIVVPMFFLSSALYPLNHAPTPLLVISSINPISYIVDALRHLLSNQGHFFLWADLLVVLVTLIVSLVFAVNRFNRIQM